ncbi:ParA family protein [Candidatus Amarolinea aalborgensis]|jgi:chromosome partitioning protein|uniref:ParA family protein n=1 Tax=Candidatus Amarolinea aalborgensis TaxID=2249329 RepID=UPI003BFA342B
MRKIAIALSKGGVGKTTTAVNLATGLALAGKRVLLVDVDTQGQVTKALGLQAGLGLADLVTAETSSPEALIPAREGLSVLAGGRALAGLKRQITRRDFGGEQVLSEALAPFEDQFDYTILDTAPGWDALTVNVLFYAHQVVAPVSLEVLTLQGLIEFEQSLTAIQKYHPALNLAYILPTFFDRRVRKSAEILEQLHSHYGARVCAPVRYNVRLSEAPGYGQSIFEYAPHSPGAEDYQALVERIMRDDRT